MCSGYFGVLRLDGARCRPGRAWRSARRRPGRDRRRRSEPHAARPPARQGLRRAGRAPGRRGAGGCPGPAAGNGGAIAAPGRNRTVRRVPPFSHRVRAGGEGPGGRASGPLPGSGDHGPHRPAFTRRPPARLCRGGGARTSVADGHTRPRAVRPAAGASGTAPGGRGDGQPEPVGDLGGGWRSGPVPTRR